MRAPGVHRTVLVPALKKGQPGDPADPIEATEAMCDRACRNRAQVLDSTGLSPAMILLSTLTLAFLRSSAR